MTESPQSSPSNTVERPWHQKRRFIVPITLIVGIALGSAAAGGGDSSKTDAAAATSTPTATVTATKTAKAPDPVTVTVTAKPAAAKTKAPTAVKTKAAGQFPLQDGDWRLDSFKPSASLGDFGGRARVTYTGDDSNGGDNLFTVTIFKGGGDVASLIGSANSVKPGDTVTVDLISSDKYVKGPYTFDFQNNL